MNRPPRHARLPFALTVLVLGLSPACAETADRAPASEVVYREQFSDFGNPSQYLRIARAAEAWEILEENGERFLRVYFEPTQSERTGLVVWDLAPLQFDSLVIEIRPVGTLASRVFVRANLFDRDGTTYTFHPYHGNRARSETAPLTEDQWNRYALAIPEDLARIFARGAEVAPFLHGQGEKVEAWESVDFENRGYRTLHFNLNFPVGSPALDERIALDFKGLTLIR